jgi:adenine-specific DNA-methyltransferase
MLKPLFIEAKNFIGTKLNKIKVDNIDEKKDLIKKFYFENHNKNKESNIIINNFLKELFYDEKNYIVSEKDGFNNQKGLIDLAIKDRNKEIPKNEVLIEIKKPNDSEMIDRNNFYKKSFYQALYYYLSDKKENNNKSEIKFLIITDTIKWFFIKTKDLEDAILDKEDSNQKKIDFNLTNNNTEKCYEEIKKYLERINEKITVDSSLFDYRKDVELPFTFFHLGDIVNKNDNPMLEVFIKCLSDGNLFNKVDVIEKNTLNQKFYKELLYIIGLEEKKVKNKVTLEKLDNNFSLMSLIKKAFENRDIFLQDDELKEKSLELSLLWINRLLFIQLFSSILQKYNIINEPILNLILNRNKSSAFSSINNLFFNVLNLPKEERKYDNIFKNIPYINSSLFQLEDIEKDITINQLDDTCYVELYKDSILNNNINDKLNIIEYFIHFLNSYNIAVDENFIDNSDKDLINASVLGKIFEKINGYKDGSFYTPSYVTEYMASNSIRDIIISKFNEKEFISKDIDSLRKEIYLDDKQKEANTIFNSITICDPAVGSGHFLVSALNAMLLYKCQLGLFEFIKPNQLEIIDDSLVINNIDNYSINEANKYNTIQNIYEEIYFAKKEIIKNSIFGVDLNPKSVKISRLRLWIELLKHTHFTSYSNYKELELLPNIDINIKEGNSLISKYPLEYSFDKNLFSNEFFYKYKCLVNQYKDSRIKSEKKEILKEIDNIKKAFKYYNKDLSFEWRYEFPEILDKEGNFIGFNLIIGNPPYFNVQTLGAKSLYIEKIKNNYSHIWQDKSDIIFYFMAKGIELSSDRVNFIVSNAFLFSDKAKKLRNYILEKTNLETVINFEQYMVFDDADITTAIINFNKNKTKNESKALVFKNKHYDKKDISSLINDSSNFFNVNYKINEVFALVNNDIEKLNSKIDGNHFKINQLFKIGKGMETAADNVFLFKDYPNEFPSEFIKKRVTGKNNLKYLISDTYEYILYFEDVEDFQNLPDSIKNYLLKNRDILENRATVKNENRPWWKYSRAMHKNLYHRNKIFCSRRAFNNTFALDESCEFLAFSNMTTIFINENDLNSKFILALLNSKVLNFRYKSIGKQTGGGSFEYFPNGISKLPIPSISKKEQIKFIELVDEIIEKKRENKSTLDLEYEIDKLAYKVYGLNDYDIKLIENSLNI